MNKSANGDYLPPSNHPIVSIFAYVITISVQALQKHLGIRHKGLEPQITEAEIAKYKKDAQVSASSPPLTVLAGYTSSVWRTLLLDFILVGQKLEKLGFTYSQGKVVIIEPVEESKHVLRPP